MNRRSSFVCRVALSGQFACLLVLAPHSLAQDPRASPSTPSELARQAFEATKRLDFARYVALFHPDELKRFKAFAVDVFKADEPSEQIHQIRRLFAPIDTAEKVAAASGSDLLAAFLATSLKAIPNFDELMAEAKLEILGEIPEPPDRVHVISRTLLPRPQPISCKMHDGRWCLLLNVETMQLITAFERAAHFRKKGEQAAIENIAATPSIEEVSVIGHVKDGDDVAQVLCRIRCKIDDFAFPVFGCYPVRKGEASWEHLGDKDQAKLVETLRAKWAR